MPLNGDTSEESTRNNSRRVAGFLIILIIGFLKWTNHLHDAYRA